MLHKKVRLFGRSVSLSVVLALVSVTVAAALWGISSIILNIYVTSSGANSVSVDSNACQVWLDAATGTNVTSCSVSGYDVNVTKASPGDEYVVETHYSAPGTNSGLMYAQPLDCSGCGATLELVSDNGCGAAIPPGGSLVVYVTFRFDADGQDTSPSTGYGPFQLTREFAATVPSCP